MKSTLAKDEQWDARMPAELRLPQVRYSRSRFVCRADFPAHILERSGMIMHRRAQRVERQTDARGKVLQARREWHAKHGGKVSTPPPPQIKPQTLFPLTMSINQLLSQVRRSSRRTRQVLASQRRKPLSLSVPPSSPRGLRRAA